jgi:hypothetical protein
MALVSSEPTLVHQLDGSQSKTPLREICLKGFSGDSYIVDRQSRQVTLKRIFISVTMMAQPGAVRDFMGVKQNEERGTLSRFLFIPCLSLAGTRFWKGISEDREILLRYEDHIRNMLSDTRERFLILSPEAMGIYIEHYNAVERMQIPGGDLEKSGWAGKQPGRTLRMAAALHCAETRDCNEINPDAMRRAVLVSEYSIRAALYTQGLVWESNEMKKLRKTLDWILRQKKTIISFREIHQRMRRDFPTAEEAHKYMNMLTEYGHVRKLEIKGPESYMISPYHRERLKLYTKYDM